MWFNQQNKDLWQTRENSLNIDTHKSSKQWDRRHRSQRNHRMKNLEEQKRLRRFVSQSENVDISDEDWSQNPKQKKMKRKLTNRQTRSYILQINQTAHQEHTEKIQNDDENKKFNHCSNSNRQDWTTRLSVQNRNQRIFWMPLWSQKTNDISYAAEVFYVRWT